MKSNLSYYPHRTDSHRHPKFKLLRTLFSNQTDGWAAEARFWALNNIIAESSDCKLDLSLKRNQATVADELGMNLSDFQNFISCLKSPDVELIFEIEPGIFSTNKVQDALHITLSKRIKAKIRKKSSPAVKFAELSQCSPELSDSSPEPLDKVKESKVNKTKLNESKVKLNETVNVISSQPSNFKHQPSPLPFTFFYFFPLTFDFTFTELVKIKISEMFFKICSLNLSTSEISRIFNILEASKQSSWHQKTELLFNLCFSFNLSPPQKKNLPYFCSMLKGKLLNQEIVSREIKASVEKKIESLETTAFLTSNVNDNTHSNSVRDIINSLSHKVLAVP